MSRVFENRAGCLKIMSMVFEYIVMGRVVGDNFFTGALFYPHQMMEIAHTLNPMPCTVHGRDSLADPLYYLVAVRHEYILESVIYIGIHTYIHTYIIAYITTTDEIICPSIYSIIWFQY